MEKILSVENLGVTFETHSVLKGISFFAQKGDVLAIVGPNGAGKSVLLRTLLGIIPHTGDIKWNKGLKINYVPQHFSIDPDLPLSVKEFLKFKENDRAKIVATLESVGLSGTQHGPEHLEKHILSQRIGQLSGGQLQRVMIAWSILDNPNVLLFDEPTSGIDIGGEETIYNLLKKLRDERELTVLLISHDLNIVYKYATSVLCINKEMICHGAPQDVLDPASLVRLYGGDAGFYQHQHAPADEHHHD